MLQVEFTAAEQKLQSTRSLSSGKRLARKGARQWILSRSKPFDGQKPASQRHGHVEAIKKALPAPLFAVCVGAPLPHFPKKNDRNNNLAGMGSLDAP